jgi:hypothetical protein
MSLIAAYYQYTLRTSSLFATENDSSCAKKTSVPGFRVNYLEFRVAFLGGDLG